MSAKADTIVEKSYLPKIKDNVYECHVVAHRIEKQLTRLEDTIQYQADGECEAEIVSPNPPIIQQIDKDIISLKNRLDIIEERLTLYNNKTIGTE